MADRAIRALNSEYMADCTLSAWISLSDGTTIHVTQNILRALYILTA